MKSLFPAYLAHLNGLTTSVLGIGVSNTPLLRLLAGAGARVTARDKKDRQALEPLATELESLGIQLRCGPAYLADLHEELIYRTPGMRPDVPEILAAVKNGSVLTSEMEDFLCVCPCQIIAVTGSDGKTTTTTLIAELLRAAGKTVFVGGNIGHPLLAETPKMTLDDLVVLELSSFQLMTMRTSPQTALVLNVTPNHLDMHLSMKEYVSAKENIFLHQRTGDLLVLGADCALTREMASRAPGRVRLFSRREDVSNGVFLRGDDIIFRDARGDRLLMHASDICIPGSHNVDNFMAACAAVYSYVSPDIMAHVARTFVGVPHRIQLIRQFDGVSYYNDSIASSPARTLAGLRSFDQKVILIAGGYDKNIPFDELGPAAAAHVSQLVLIGATAPKIRAAVSSVAGAPPIHNAGTLDAAVTLARQLAHDGDVVLLSPACASFDQYANFEARGEHFVQLVAALA